MRIMDLLSLLLRSAAGCWLLACIPRPAEVPSGSPRPSCSVVIPARNEVHTLPTLLSSLDGQLRPGDEVLVVDDGSDDGTAALECPPGAEIVPAAGLPDEWAGKCWACWTGSRQARGEVLVFLDADTEVLPGGLDRLVGVWAERGGLVSVQPFHVVRRPYERLSAFFNVVSMMGVDAFTPLGSARPPRGAFGPAMVVDRQEYLRLGGHAAVRDELLDDVALARRWQTDGGAVSVLGGRGTIRFRMYPGGLGHLVEGWSKNLAGGAAGARLTTLVLIVAWVSLCIQAAWWLLRLPLDSGADAADLRLGLAAYTAVVLQLWWMLRRVGSFGVATAALFPVPLVFFLGLFCRSAALTAVRGRVTWKGREISTRRRPAA
jgi:4,4'-diaponeurosporenoate glycosyltransferase